MAKIPKTLGGKADALFKLRAERLAAQKKVDALKAQESALQEAVLDHLRHERADKASGKLATVSRSTVAVPKVDDWPKLQSFIKKHDAFELLHRRLTDAAFRERWSQGEKIDGVHQESVTKLSVTKR